MKPNFEQLHGNKDREEIVVSSSCLLFKSGEFTSIATQAFREFCLDEIKKQLINNGKGTISLTKNNGTGYNQWKKLTEDGTDCEILGANTKGRKKGKVRIRVVLEFCPDDIEEGLSVEDNNKDSLSSLDDIHQTIS